MSPTRTPGHLAPWSRRSGPWRVLMLAVIAALLAYGGMAWLADWQQVGAALANLPPVLWLGVGGLSCVSYGLRFLRWQGLLAALGHPVPWRRSLAIYLAGFALTLTPGKAGETVRSLYLRPLGVDFGHSLVAFVVERLFDLLAVGAMASLAVLALGGYGPWVWSVFLGCVALALLLRARSLPWIVARWAGPSLADGLDALAVLLRGRVAMRALPLSFLAWAAQGLALYVIVQALVPAPGLAPGMALLVGLYCLALLAGALSFIPGGLGVTEAALALLLVGVGLEQAQAVTAALLARGLTLWLAVAIGLLAMGRLAFVAKSATRA